MLTVKILKIIVIIALAIWLGIIFPPIWILYAIMILAIPNNKSVKKESFVSGAPKDFDTQNKGKKLLIFDDNAFLLNMYSLKFTKNGFNVATNNSVNDGEEKFVDFVFRLKPDAVIMDLIAIPTERGRNGFEAVRIIKDDVRTKDIPVIFLTNEGRLSDIEKASELGGMGYINKATVKPQEVVEEVKRIMGW